ncbi:MAG: hypothetical protein CVU05_14740, partial [Bacteroidetes bacterium HGW-Bacteroidetes-21]
MKSLLRYYLIIITIQLISNNLSGQVIYTDFNPDINIPILDFDDSLQFDFDKNGTNDISFKISGSISPYGPNYYLIFKTADEHFQISTDTSAGYPQAAKLEYGDTLSKRSLWESGSITMGHLSGTGLNAPWSGININQFIGVRKITPTDTLYGYFTVCVYVLLPNISQSTIIFQDIQIANTISDLTYTGQYKPILAHSVLAEDIDNTKSGDDLRVNFAPCINESLLSSYRILIVPEAQALSFNTTLAAHVSASNCLEISPIDTNVSVIYGTGHNDINGNAIANLSPYRVFVLSLPNINVFTDTILSEMSPPIMLTTPAVQPLNILAFDSADAGNASDLVIYAEPALVNYQIYFVPFQPNRIFTLDSAMAIPAGRYAETGSNGMNPGFSPDASTTDINGNTITNDSEYLVYVLRTPSGTDKRGIR